MSGEEVEELAAVALPWPPAFFGGHAPLGAEIASQPFFGGNVEGGVSVHGWPGATGFFTLLQGAESASIQSP